MTDVQGKTNKSKRDNASKTRASLKMEQKIKKDLVDHTAIKERATRSGMFPGTHTPLISSRAIIRSIDHDHYPEVDEEPEGPMSSWVREQLYDLSSEGVEIWTGASMGTEIIMDDRGYWEILSDDDDIRKSDPRYKSARIMVIDTIPYYNIIDYRKDGDEYYNDPHLFCRFEFEGTPFSKRRYQIYYGEKNELPTYDLQPSKKIKFEK
jgi:hypothetical protein